MLLRRLVQGALLLVLSIAKSPPPPSPLYVHSVLHPPPAFGDGCDETLDFRFVAADAAALRARAAALAEAAAAAAAAVERETREREAALVAARLASALGEYAHREAFATAEAADDAAAADATTRHVACQEALLGADGGAALAALVDGATDLSVVDCDLGAGGFEKVLVAALSSPGLRRLRVASDLVGDAAFVRAAKRLKKANASNASLARVEVERVGLGPSGAEALCRALAPHAPTLARLSLRGNCLCDGGVAAVAAKLVAAAPALAEIDLARTACGDAGAVALARALAKRPPGSAPVAVDVSGNELGGRGVAALAASPAVSRLDARRNALGGDDATLVPRALRKNERLEALGLAHCGLGPGAADLILSAAARKGARLEVLDLSGNALTTAEVERRRKKGEHALVGALSKMASKALPPAAGDGGLGLSAPDVDVFVAAARALGAGQAPELRWLGLSDTGLTPTHARLLATAAKKRRGRGLDAVEVVALANGAAAAKQRKEPVI